MWFLRRPDRCIGGRALVLTGALVLAAVLGLACGPADDTPTAEPGVDQSATQAPPSLNSQPGQGDQPVPPSIDTGVTGLDPAPVGDADVPAVDTVQAGDPGPGSDPDQMSDFTVTLLDGQNWTLSEHEGSPTVLVFWAHW